MQNQKHKSFPFVVGKTPKVLILGSLPGKESLRLQQYYAYKQNSFWKIIYKLLADSEPDKDYSSKLNFIKSNNLALWDVCKAAYRESSLDSDIKNEIPNEIDELLENNKSIRLVIFNGQKSAKLFDKYFKKRKGVDYFTALSSSPANAKFSFTEKLDNWRIIIEYLNKL